MIAECQEEETEYGELSWSTEFPRKPDVEFSPAIAAKLDAVGRIDRQPRKKVEWKKPRSKKKKPEALRKKVDYLTIYSHHHRNLDYNWTEVAILSEIDFWMQKEGGPCFASMRHLASVGRVGRQTAHNYATQMKDEGKLIVLGYRGRTKARIVAPEHSAFPKVSKRILDEWKRKSEDEIPF